MVAVGNARADSSTSPSPPKIVGPTTATAGSLSAADRSRSQAVSLRAMSALRNTRYSELVDLAPLLHAAANPRLRPDRTQRQSVPAPGRLARPRSADELSTTTVSSSGEVCLRKLSRHRASRAGVSK